MTELRAVVISDMHGGSRFGPMPVDWKWADGTLAGASKPQEWLFDKYVDCVKEFHKPDILFVDGDAVDGHQHLNYATEVMNSDGFEQVRIAEFLIKLWKPKQIYIIYGSPYHVRFAGIMVERFIARHLRAKAAGWAYRGDINQVKTSIAHEITVSTTTWQYRTTPVAQQLVLNRLQKAEKSANLIIRAHAHYFTFAGFSDQLGVINPGWQGQTPYGAKKVPELIPKIGMFWFNIPSKGKEFTDWGWRTWDGPMLELESYQGEDNDLDNLIEATLKSRRKSKK